MCKSIYTRREIEFMYASSGMTRRHFSKMLAALGVLGYIDAHSIAMATTENRRKLGILANQTAGAEGSWSLTDIEGEIPKELNGTLYRTAPGESERFGVTFNHLFDGDAFVTGYSTRDGKLWMSARFVNSPERIEELAAGKMIYSEFGTKAPGSEGLNAKNQPSVNIVPWDGRLLGLSEGGHPTAIDPKDLSFQSYWDFHGTLPKNVSFTAHPKYDPATHEGFCYGMEQGPSMALCVYRMDPSGKLEQLHKIPQPGFFMLHDMFITKEHILFVIPPVKYNLGDLLSGRTTIADAIKYFENEPLRVLVMSRDGSGEPMTIEQPASMVFHNGNAFMEDGALVLDTFLNPDGQVLEVLHGLTKEGGVTYNDSTYFTRMKIDPAKGELVDRSIRGEGQDFPRFDIRRSGQDARYLYVGQATDNEDSLRFDRILRHDLHTGSAVTADTTATRALGEAVYVPKSGSDIEGEGWVLNLGFDGDRNETFLEFRDAATLELQARAWTGNHFPLGFHGNFVNDWYVNEPA